MIKKGWKGAYFFIQQDQSEGQCLQILGEDQKNGRTRMVSEWCWHDNLGDLIESIEAFLDEYGKDLTFPMKETH